MEDNILDKPVLVFGGTSEGRRLAEIFDADNRKCTVCVATEYGEKLLPESENISIICGRMDCNEICQLLGTGNKYSYVIDATHPYASVISGNARSACIKTNTAYLRLLRSETDSNIYNDGIKIFTGVLQAAKYLDKTTGRILLTTGSKELPVFCSEIKDKSRIVARVLPSAAAIEACNNAGIYGRQIIAMHGPFSKEVNTAIIKQAEADFIVTKESGNAGGFPEKIAAAAETGAEVILIKRPVEEEGYSLDEILRITGVTNIESGVIQKEISLIGTGMGNTGTLSAGGKEALENAGLIIGSGRLLETARAVTNALDKEMFNAYDADIIYNYIKRNPQYKNIAILLSGDTGFYSGAGRLREKLQKLQGYNIQIIPGISSVAYFAARLKINWQDIKLSSLHGRTQNVIAAIKSNEKTFILLGMKDSVSGLADICIKYGLKGLVFHIGCNFGYSNEEIISGSPEDFTGFINKGFLYCAIIENPYAKENIITHGIPDSQFIRGNVPMTKEEIREISVSKLHLVKDAIVYDIGAGTGSVSVECARMAYNGKVYAVEKNEEAVKLIKQNKILHGTDNLEIITGEAPAVLEGLEVPTHVFIGGSSGKLNQVIDTIFSKNNNARIVINAVTLETVTEVQSIIKEKGLEGTDITCIIASKAKKAGNYHIMAALNPVWIIVLERI